LSTGTYINATGEEKKSYGKQLAQFIGRVIPKNCKIKLDSVPFVDGGWNGWATCFEPEDNKFVKSDRPNKVKRDQEDDVPF
jgi:hypothetical protein